MLEALYLRYGYDFRDYAPGSLRRRLDQIVAKEVLGGLSELQQKALADKTCFQRLLNAITVNVTDFFRDPHFFKVFREQVIPILKTYPFIRIWHAGCSSGEEVYSLAIVLTEEGVYERCRIYGTDINDSMLDKAKEAIYPLAKMKQFTQNYLKAGGKEDFSTYYTARYDHAVFQKTLRKHITFSRHNLTTDAGFNEFNVIICRNVMIYFNRKLQGRVHELFYQSLAPLGYLGLGDKENLNFSPHESDYGVIDADAKIFRRTR